VYLTAVLLEVILHEELAQASAWSGLSPTVLSVSAIGVVSVVWTWMGGIATVIWTDVVLFIVFLSSVVIALITLLHDVEGGMSQVLSAASEAGKLRFFDFDARFSTDYTFWAALIAQGLGGLGQYGTDQLMAQRIFCCKSKREAQKAMVASYGAMLVTLVVSLIGLALHAYYLQHPLQGESLDAYKAVHDRIFPIFITTVIPSPFKGLIVAGAFAAAISSLDSILAALSQTTLSAFYRPAAQLDAARAERSAVFVSRALVLVFGLLLCTIAVVCEQLVAKYGSILNLALAMPTYTQGAVLGAFVLAILPLGLRGDGYTWAALLAVLTIFCLAWRQPFAVFAQSIAALALFCAWVGVRIDREGNWRRPLEWARSLLLAGVLALLPWLCATNRIGAISWVWYVLIGALIAMVFGWLLDSRGENQRSTS
jgi:Na+/proline symporter